jgi:hypothetical protein
MFGSAHGAMRLPQSLMGLELRRRYRAPPSGERSTSTMCMDHIRWCPCSWYEIQLYDRIVHVLEEFMLETGATKGRDLRLEVRKIRSRASRDGHGHMVWLDFRAPRRHLGVDVTVTSARTNTIVPHIIGARTPLPGTLALGAQHGKLDAVLRTSALLGTPSVHSVHGYYPYVGESGARWRLWRLSCLIAWLFWWHGCRRLSFIGI